MLAPHSEKHMFAFGGVASYFVLGVDKQICHMVMIFTSQ